MNYLNGYNLQNMEYAPTFFGYILDNTIIGVNSGHRCSNNSYRSRGLWVDEKHRGKGIGKQLLLSTIQQGQHEMTKFIWSYPRKTSWPTYKSVGFIRTSHWLKSETSEANSFCILT
jgi:GNAT superfamily N-acetyltransferase